MTDAPAARRSKENGVLMVALMAGIAIVMILSTVAVQSWADISRRDKEAEMMFRAQDLARALKRYQLRKGKLPVELKELEEPLEDGRYVLRQLWKDPLVKGGKWQLLYLSPTGGVFDPSAPALPQAGDTSQTGSTPSLLNPSQPALFPPPASGTGLGTGQPGTGTGDPTGMPIAGVKTRSKDKPFRRYREKDEYTDWIFTVFDLDPRGAPVNPQQTQQNQQNQQNGQNPFGGADPNKR